MMSREGFYIQVLSNASELEFPNNRANHFKNRLPYPLRFEAGQWSVGLSSISLPDSKVSIYHLAKRGEYILSTSWIKYVPKQRGSDLTEKHGRASVLINDLEPLDSIVNGVSFMKAAIESLNKQRIENEAGPKFGTRFENNDGRLMYLKFLWEGEDLWIDNNLLFHGGPSENPAVEHSPRFGSQDGMVKEGR